MTYGFDSVSHIVFDERRHMHSVDKYIQIARHSCAYALLWEEDRRAQFTFVFKAFAFKEQRVMPMPSLYRVAIEIHIPDSVDL